MTAIESNQLLYALSITKEPSAQPANESFDSNRCKHFWTSQLAGVNVAPRKHSKEAVQEAPRFTVILKQDSPNTETCTRFQSSGCHQRATNLETNI